MISVLREINSWAVSHGGEGWGAIGMWILLVLFLVPIAAACAAVLCGIIGNEFYGIFALGVATGWLIKS